jgi:hypothetical protein
MFGEKIIFIDNALTKDLLLKETFDVVYKHLSEIISELGIKKVNNILKMSALNSIDSN